MIAISIILCIPSILYLIMNKTVDQFNGYYTYTLVKTGNLNFGILNGVIVVGLMLIFSIIYLLIVKEENKIFKNKKQIIIFIMIISFIFMLILPYLSSDVFYYIGDSWVCSKYHENPYYTSVKDLQDMGINDEILNNTRILESHNKCIWASMEYNCSSTFKFIFWKYYYSIIYI